jgi:hypothetical protein
MDEVIFMMDDHTGALSVAGVFAQFVPVRCY